MAQTARAEIRDEGCSEAAAPWSHGSFFWNKLMTQDPKMLQMMTDADPKKPQRVMKAFLQMKKFDIPTLQRAYDGDA
jgi:hypothetical protein